MCSSDLDPSRDVVLIDAHEVGSAASGRNGGFMEASLTHGIANGQARFPNELPVLEELGLRNLNEIEAAIQRYRIDCDYERTGVIDIATTFHSPTYLDELRDDFTQLRALGQRVEWLDEAAVRAQVNSPSYTGGLWRKDRAALVDPARLAWGLKSAAMSLGVRIYEDTKATDIERDGVGVLVETPLGSIRAAVESGVIKKGIMASCIRRGVTVVMAGTIRDDGPVPGVMTDSMKAQTAMREAIPGVGLALLVASTLHAVATGNLLPATIPTVCVDINISVPTKLADRGSYQAVGLVMDAASFLNELARHLGRSA